MEADYQKWNKTHPLINYQLGFHAEYTCDKHLLEGVTELSRKYKNDRAKVKLAQYDILEDIEALCNEYNTMSS